MAKCTQDMERDSGTTLEVCQKLCAVLLNPCQWALNLSPGRRGQMLCVSSLCIRACLFASALCCHLCMRVCISVTMCVCVFLSFIFIQQDSHTGWLRMRSCLCQMAPELIINEKKMCANVLFFSPLHLDVQCRKRMGEKKNRASAVPQIDLFLLAGWGVTKNPKSILAAKMTLFNNHFLVSELHSFI